MTYKDYNTYFIFHNSLGQKVAVSRDYLLNYISNLIGFQISNDMFLNDDDENVFSNLEIPFSLIVGHRLRHPELSNKIISVVHKLVGDCLEVKILFIEDSYGIRDKITLNIFRNSYSIPDKAMKVFDSNFGDIFISEDSRNLIIPSDLTPDDLYMIRKSEEDESKKEAEQIEISLDTFI